MSEYILHKWQLMFFIAFSKLKMYILMVGINTDASASRKKKTQKWGMKNNLGGGRRSNINHENWIYSGICEVG